MNKNIQTLIAKGESESLEFKTSFGKETMETLSAFANSNGGTVLIGINDKGKIIGVDITQESIQQWINQIKNSTSPSIIPDAESFIHEGKTVISLSVISYPIKPISIKGKYYKRIHNSNHLMGLIESNFSIREPFPRELACMIFFQGKLPLSIMSLIKEKALNQ
ncbi:MAG: ATP-binding protein [Desulfobacterales bacterium]|nr:ATP-binding protein [Desulfobacterales bacterium]